MGREKGERTGGHALPAFVAYAPELATTNPADISPSLPQGMLRTARISRHLTRGEYVAPASVRASEQVVGSGWWWVVVLGDEWWVLVGGVTFTNIQLQTARMRKWYYGAPP